MAVSGCARKSCDRNASRDSRLELQIVGYRAITVDYGRVSVASRSSEQRENTAFSSRANFFFIGWGSCNLRQQGVVVFPQLGRGVAICGFFCSYCAVYRQQRGFCDSTLLSRHSGQGVGSIKGKTSPILIILLSRIC